MNLELLSESASLAGVFSFPSFSQWMWNLLSWFWGKIANVSVEENPENLEERWLAVILDLCSSIWAVMRIHQFSYGGKNERHVGALKRLEVCWLHANTVLELAVIVIMFLVLFGRLTVGQLSTALKWYCVKKKRECTQNENMLAVPPSRTYPAITNCWRKKSYWNNAAIFTM